MGKIQIPGVYSGRTYNVNIAGDFPTPDEEAYATQVIDQRENDFRSQFESEFGDTFDDMPGTALGRGLDRGKTSAYGALGSAGRYAGETTGWDWLENKGRTMEGKASAERIRENTSLPDPLDWDNVRGVGSAASYVGEMLGQSLPQMGASIAGATVAGLAAPAAVPAIAAGVAGGALAQSPFFAGYNVQRQEEQYGEVRDPVKLVTATIGQSLVSSIGERLMLGPLGKIFGKAGGNIVGNAARGAGRGALAELPAEVSQQILERWQAGLPLDDEEALSEYVSAGIGALAVGGTLGGVAGGVKGSTDFNSDTEVPPDNPREAARDDEETLGAQELSQVETARRAGVTTEAQPLSEDVQNVTEVPIEDTVFSTAELTELGLPKGNPLYTAVEAGFERPDQIYERARRVIDAAKESANPQVKERGARLAELLSRKEKAREQRELAILAAGERRSSEPDTGGESLPGLGAEAAPDTGGPTGPAGRGLGAAQSDTQLPADNERSLTSTLTEAEAFEAAVPGKNPSRTVRAPAFAEPLRAPAEKLKQEVSTAMKRYYGDAKRPVTQVLRDRKIKIKPTSPTATDWKTAGITAKRVPGLFKNTKTAKEYVSDIRAKDMPELQDIVKVNEDGFYDPEDLKQAILSELAGQPRMPQQVAEADRMAKEVDRIDDTVRQLQAYVDDQQDLQLTQAEVDDIVGRVLDNDLAVEDALVETMEVVGKDGPLDALKKLKLATEPQLEEQRTRISAFETAQAEAPADAPVSGEWEVPDLTEDDLSADIPDIDTDLGPDTSDSTTAPQEQLPPDSTAATTEASSEDGILPSGAGDTAGGPTRADRAPANPTPEYPLPPERPGTPAMARNAAAGQTTEAAGQVIPEGVAPAESNVLDDSPVETPTQERDRQNRLARVESQQERQAREGLDRQLRLKRQRDLKDDVWEFVDRTLESERRDVSSASDKQRVLELLNTGFAGAKRKVSNSAFAAKNYFLKNPDISTAIDAIAWDAQVAPYKRFSSKGDNAKEMNPGEVNYYMNTGRDWGSSAGRWVIENLGDDARKLFYTRMEEYRVEENKAEDVVVEIEARDRSIKENREIFNIITQGGRPEAIVERAALYSPLHPRAVAHLRDGDLRNALDVIAATSGDRRVARLARVMIPLVNKTRSQVVRTDAEWDNVLRAFEGGKTRADYAPGDMPMAYYVPPGADTGVDNRVLFYGRQAINAHAVLHEMVHAATADRMLNQPNSPAMKRLTSLHARAEEALGKNATYGLTNLREFVAEGLSNKDFRAKLAAIPADPADTLMSGPSLLDKFKQVLMNVLRSIMGQPAKDQPNITSELDKLFDQLLAPAPTRLTAENLKAEALAQSKARKQFDFFKNKAVEFTDKHMPVVSNIMEGVGADEWRMSFTRATVPVHFLAKLAKDFMPTALQVPKLIGWHGSEVRRLTMEVNATSDYINDWLGGGDKAQRVKDFSEVQMKSTYYEVDRRKPKSHYEKFTVTYDKYDAEGDIEDVVTIERDTRAEREKLYTQIRDRQQAGAPVSGPRRGTDPTSDEGLLKLKIWDELTEPYNRIVQAGGREALDRVYAMPDYLRREMQDAFRVRLEAMTDNNKALTEKLYAKILKKLYAKDLIDPYQPLLRRGRYWVSYSAYDPDTVPRDGDGNATGPGEIKVYKHSFETVAERRDAMKKLQDPAMVQEFNVQGLVPYQQNKEQFGRTAPSMQFVRELVSKIEGSDQLQDTTGIIENIMDLVFDAAPETSFIKSFNKRKGVRGFEQDITPIDKPQTRSQIIENIRGYGNMTAHRAADLRYSVRAQQMASKLGEELTSWTQNENPENNTKKADAAQRYYTLLNEFLKAPFYRRAKWSRNLTTLGYGLTLGYNVSTALITYLHVPMFVAPYFFGKYGGAGKVTRALGLSTQILGRSSGERTVDSIGPDGELLSERQKINMWDLSLSNLDYTDSENAWAKPLYEQAERYGIFNRSLTMEAIDATHAQNLMQKMGAHSGLLQHHSERYVREATLISSYLLEMHKRYGGGENFNSFAQKLMNNQLDVPEADAQKIGELAVEDSDLINGQIYAAQAPLMSQTNIGSVLFLFKRFPLAMMNMLASITRQTFPDKNSVDRKIAMTQLAGMAGMMGLFAGAMGMPFMHMITATINMFLDDDEDDAETLMKRYMGERGVNGLLDYYTGLSLSSRVGLSGVFFRPGFNTEDQPGYVTLLEGVGGPVVGLARKYTDRFPQLLGEGEYWRAFEAGAPSAVANVARAGRYYRDEGIQTKRGDPILNVSPYELGAQTFGFMPARYRAQLQTNSAMKRRDNALNEQVSGLLSDLYYAKRTGNFLMEQQVKRKIREFNSEHPQSRITQPTIDRSLKGHARRSKEIVRGISLSSRNEHLFGEYEDAFGPPTILGY